MDSARAGPDPTPRCSPTTDPSASSSRTASDDRQSSGEPSTVIRTSPFASLGPDAVKHPVAGARQRTRRAAPQLSSASCSAATQFRVVVLFGQFDQFAEKASHQDEAQDPRTGADASGNPRRSVLVRDCTGTKTQADEEESRDSEDRGRGKDNRR